MMAEELVLEMRVRIPVDPENIERCKDHLRELVAEVDPRPGFYTSERWFYERLSQPVPLSSEVPFVNKPRRAGKDSGRL